MPIIPPAGSMMPRPFRTLFRPLAISEVGMGTQQSFMETIAANIANAETTSTPEGGAYHRRIAVVHGNAASGSVTTQVVDDPTAGRVVYDPGHPDADKNGYVTMPNVDVPTETVDLMIARRMHEANATAFQTAKAMLRRAIDI